MSYQNIRNFGRNVLFIKYMTQLAGSKDPLHGKTLEAILNELVVRYGWKELGILIPIDCFLNKASINSSLKMLRKVSWARAKVEKLYTQMVLEDREKAKPKSKPAVARPVVAPPVAERKPAVITPGLTAVPICLRAQIKVMPGTNKSAVESFLRDKLYNYFASFKTGGCSVMVDEITNALSGAEGVEKLESLNFFREDKGAKGPYPRNIQMDKQEIAVEGKMILLLR